MGLDQFPHDDVERPEEDDGAEAYWLEQNDERASAEAFHRDAAKARIDAHRAFDAIWKSGAMKRVQAYKWMQRVMGLTWQQAHIALLGADECARLIRLVKARGA